jgi:hypothetical protein
MQQALLLFCAALLSLAIAGCGGGRSTPDPTPTATGLDGQLVQGGTKVTSAKGDGLSGVEVQLISRGDGSVKASALTSVDGRFSFRELPSGDFLLKLKFRSSGDLNGDGLLDEIESYLPVEIVDDVVTALTAVLEFADSDSDADVDSLKVDVRLRVGADGIEKQFVRLHRHRHGDTKVDDDGDGDFDDEFDDDDSNGLPDGSNGGGQYPQGPKLKGEIEAIGATSITVDGQTFIVNDATSFRIKGDRNVDAAEFEVGDEVQVTSFTNTEGDKVALEIKLKKDKGGGNGDDDDDEQEVTGVIEALTDASITVGGETFTFSEDTLFLLLDKTEGTLDDFAVGDTVELKARLIADEWVVVRLKLEEEGDEVDERELTGAIEAISASSVTLGGEAFVIDASTEFKLFSGDPGTLLDFAVGANVELTADLEAGQWVVRTLKLADAPVELEDFTMNFTMFEPHLGHTLHLKVVDTETGTTVGTVTPFAVTEAAFSVTLPGILESGQEYNVDFWADFDASGTLDGTPLNGGVDHAWRLTEAADGNGLTIDYMHDTNFVDIRPF